LDRGKQWSLLLVRGDGSRMVRVTFSRRLALVVLGSVSALVTAVGVFVSDWQLTRVRNQEVGGLLREIDAQRATVSALKLGMAEVQKEVASWGDLHARIWEPFGPDTSPRTRGTGIGGRAGVLLDLLPGVRSERKGSGPEAAERLVEAVREEGESLRALERLISRAGKALASLPSRWPVRGAVNSEFGQRRSPWTSAGEFHSGIDIAAARGTPVHAPAAGTVVFAGAHGDYGLTVMVDHADELRTIYGHLSKITVTPGQKIVRGTELGFTGNTGRSSGPHLHYEIVVANRPVNPRAYFWD
jgi:murein DD-endopeptidase MepM/ murein hydrolase activator NlpD